MRIDPADHHLHDDQAYAQLDGGARKVDAADRGDDQQVAARVHMKAAQVEQQRDEGGLHHPGADQARRVEAVDAGDDAARRHHHPVGQSGDELADGVAKGHARELHVKARQQQKYHEAGEGLD